MNDTTTRIVLVFKLFADWTERIYDIKGAFFKGKFEDSKEIFMEVSQGMKHHYWGSALLRLLKPIYGLHNCLGEFKIMQMSFSKFDFP